MSIYATLKVSLAKRNMKKQNQKLSLIDKMKRAPLLVIVAVILVGSTSVGVVHASIQSQIDALNAQNAKNQGNVDKLAIQASNYQDAIEKLQSRIAGIQK